MKKSTFSNQKITILLLVLFFCNHFTFSQTVNHWETAVFNNDTWLYLVPTAEPDPLWRSSTTFTNTSWKTGKGGFGYNTNSYYAEEGTTIWSSGSKPQAIYTRITFNVTDTSKIAKAALQMSYDDAFVAYLNGVEIARSGIKGTTPPPYNQTTIGGVTDHNATMLFDAGNYWSGEPENFILNKTMLKACLKPGTNVLAIQVHNSSTRSSDLSSNAFLSFGITNSATYFRKCPSWFKEPIDFSTFSSTLPIINIATENGASIVKDVRTKANMKIIHKGGNALNNLTDLANIYDGNTGIKVRGSSSASYPQTPYSIETRDALDLNMDTSLLGMPRDNDWVLISHYNDKSLVRNALSYHIFTQMGHYAPRMQHCEVVLNNDYRGIYLFGEKIKRSSGRVNIANLKLTDLAGDSLTGGYIFKTDYDDGPNTYWTSKFSPLNRPGGIVKFVYSEPEADLIAPEQKAYIADYVNQLETVLYGADFKDPVKGYRAYLDVNSFIDYWILEEVARNVDGYKKSRFFYKNKDSKDKLIYSGPVWDFDWAWKSLNDCYLLKNTTGAGWAYKINECNVTPIPPSWEVRLLEDPAFANAVHARYLNLRQNILSLNYINHYIDSIAGMVSEAQVRHFDKYKILGYNNSAPEIDEIPTTFEEEITKLKNWIATRISWLDANMVGVNTTDVPTIESAARIRVFPNPVWETLYVESDNKIQNISICNSVGASFLNTQPKHYEAKINVSDLKPGLYIVKVTLANGTTTTQKLVKE